MVIKEDTMVNAFYNCYGLAQMALASYDELTFQSIPEIIATSLGSKSPLVYEINGQKHTLYVSRLALERSKYTAEQCLQQGTSLEATALCDLRHTVVDAGTGQRVSSVTYKRCTGIQFPLMVNSALENGHYSQADQARAGSAIPSAGGSYKRYQGLFVLGGQLRSITAQLAARPDRIRVLANGRKLEAFVTSEHSGKLRSASNLVFSYTPGEPGVRVVIPFEKGSNRISEVLGSLLGVLSDTTSKDLAGAILADTHLAEGSSESIRSHLALMVADIDETPPDKRRSPRWLEYFPAQQTSRDKFTATVRVLLRLAAVAAGADTVDSAYSVADRRVDTPGYRLALVIRQLVQGARRALYAMLLQQISSARHSVRPAEAFSKCSAKATKALRSALIIGGLPRGNADVATGSCKAVDKQHRLHLCYAPREISWAGNAKASRIDNRQLGPCSYGLLCAGLTPESGSAGLISELAGLSVVRGSINAELVRDTVRRVLRVVAKDSLAAEPAVLVVVQETPLGYIAGEQGVPADQVARRARQVLRRARRTGELDRLCSVYVRRRRYALAELMIDVDPGVILRPLVCLDLGTVVPPPSSRSWQSLLDCGYVEMISKDEELAHVHTGEQDATHAEVSPTLALYGTVGAHLPVVNHNPAPRTLYMCSMLRQACEATQHTRPLGKRVRSMVQAQHPIVTTRASLSIGSAMGEGPHAPLCGVNAVVMVLPLSENQEDAIVVNRAAIQRGLFQYTVRHRVVAKGCLRRRRSEPRLGLNPVAHAAYADRADLYDLHTGALRKGEHVEPGVPLILMAMGGLGPRGAGQRREPACSKVPLQDCSVMCPASVRGGVVESVTEIKTPGGLVVELVVVELTSPEIGDKLSSRHAQKGTIGAIKSPEDLPYEAATGMVPDLVINPCAFPSRMTIGQVLESSMAYLACESCDLDTWIDNRSVDGTAFAASERWSNRGEYCGIRPQKVLVHNGQTGLLMPERVSTGLVYYMPLEHVARDKVHARSTGRRDANRQPTGGRANAGGLRLGEMERDSLLAHGASLMLKDRLCESSDATMVPICCRCRSVALLPPDREAIARGLVPAGALARNGPVCRQCGSLADIRHVNLPYAMLSFSHELSALHMDLKFEIE